MIRSFFVLMLRQNYIFNIRYALELGAHFDYSPLLFAQHSMFDNDIICYLLEWQNRCSHLSHNFSPLIYLNFAAYLYLCLCELGPRTAIILLNWTLNFYHIDSLKLITMPTTGIDALLRVHCSLFASRMKNIFTIYAQQPNRHMRIKNESRPIRAHYYISHHHFDGYFFIQFCSA